MAPIQKSLRVLIVDDNQDGADTLGLLVEELGNTVHVTYGGTQAVDVAAAFRADLMLVDLSMPDLNGCELAKHFRQIPAFAQTRLVAITGHADEGHKTLAMKAGFDTVLFKPVALAGIKRVLASVKVPNTARRLVLANGHERNGIEQRLPIGEARRIRNQRKSKTLTQIESEAAICDGIFRFQEEYMAWGSEQILAHFIKDSPGRACFWCVDSSRTTTWQIFVAGKRPGLGQASAEAVT